MRLVDWLEMIERLRERIRRGMWPGPPAAASALDGPESRHILSSFGGAPVEASPADIGRLRRERRRLLRSREQSVRDLGGLTLEMVRREAFKPDLLKRRARDILGLEDGVHDVQDALSDAREAVPDPSIGPGSPCSCGSSNERGAAFCVACGRALKPASGLRACHHCAQALPGGAQFCPGCGAAREARDSPTGAGW